jgi:hypothetical protein
MGTKYTFFVKGIDVDDNNIDDEVNNAVEHYAKEHGIEHALVQDFFNDGHGVRINIEDVGE